MTGALVFSKWLGYCVAGVSLLGGAAIVAGVLAAETVPPRFRITLGVVLILLGVYRFVITRTRTAEAESRNE